MDDRERELRESLGDDMYEEVLAQMESMGVDIGDMDIVVVGEPTDPFEAAWLQMYPVAEGPWVTTDEGCPHYPNCTCNGKRRTRQVYSTALN